MRNFTNPLDNIHIASPCSADWNEMYGDDRKRFCGDCKMNVYNLSDMTRTEAENLLMISEGRLCVRFFRRADGTVLTRNCPVGWQAAKQKASRIATAAFSVVAAFFTGMLAMRTADTTLSLFPIADVPPVETSDYPSSINNDVPEIGDADLTEWEGKVSLEDVRGRPSQPIRSFEFLGRP